jgi:hypothetical protein
VSTVPLDCSGSSRGSRLVDQHGRLEQAPPRAPDVSAAQRPCAAFGHTHAARSAPHSPQPQITCDCFVRSDRGCRRVLRIGCNRLAPPKVPVRGDPARETVRASTTDLSDGCLRPIPSVRPVQRSRTARRLKRGQQAQGLQRLYRGDARPHPGRQRQRAWLCASSGSRSNSRPQFSSRDPRRRIGSDLAHAPSSAILGYWTTCGHGIADRRILGWSGC